MAKRAASASSAHVAQVARDALSRGNAVDAVVAGVLAAAGETPSVLLGPVQMLVGGAGAGLLAIDGRVRQPGVGGPRPRGVLPGASVPAQARVGVSALPAALAAVLASSGRWTLGRAAGPALETARALSPERAAVIRAVALHGAGALAQEALAVELMAVAGRASGGSLTSRDLSEVRPAIVSCDEQALPAGLLFVPWRGGSTLDASTTHTVAAIDSRGLAAVACYEAPLEGLPIPALGLVAPLFAAPVMRGETRVPPGAPRHSPSPIALLARRGLIEFVVAIAQAADAEDILAGALPRLAEGGALGTLFAALQGTPAAVGRTGDNAFVIASA